MTPRKIIVREVIHRDASGTERRSWVLNVAGVAPGVSNGDVEAAVAMGSRYCEPRSRYEPLLLLIVDAGGSVQRAVSFGPVMQDCEPAALRAL